MSQQQENLKSPGALAKDLSTQGPISSLRTVGMKITLINEHTLPPGLALINCLEVGAVFDECSVVTCDK